MGFRLQRRGYTHALLNEYEADIRTQEQAEQEIARAFVVLRIVKPISLAWHMVVHAEGAPPSTTFAVENRIGFGSVYYLPESQIRNRITPRDIRRARVLWPNIQLVFENWQQHKRLVEALRIFEDAQAIPFSDRRHILCHAGLEHLLCTSSQHIGQQLQQRISMICPTVTTKEIGSITKMRAGLAHSGKVSEELQGRGYEIEDKLERILRACLYHVFASSEELEVFASEEKLKANYPVTVEKYVSRPTGKTILI